MFHRTSEEKFVATLNAPIMNFVLVCVLLPHAMSSTTYATWSDAETDVLLEWLSSPDNYGSYYTGIKTKAYTAIAKALGTKTMKQVRNTLTAGAALRMSQRPLHHTK
jgi:hypothetical protein